MISCKMSGYIFNNPLLKYFIYYLIKPVLNSTGLIIDIKGNITPFCLRSSEALGMKMDIRYIGFFNQGNLLVYCFYLDAKAFLKLLLQFVL